MILMELTIVVLIPFKGVSLDLLKLLYEVFILDLHKYLGNMHVKGRQYNVRLTRWSLRTSFINLPSRISIIPLIIHLALVISPPIVRLPFSPPSFGLNQLLSSNVLVSLTLEC